MQPPRIAVVGAGKMGANHARVIATSGRAQLAMVIDVDLGRAQRLAEKYGCRSGSHLTDIQGLDAAVLAIPTDVHRDSAIHILSQGIPLLIEKPISTSADEVDEIVRHAEKSGAPLMCGFVERFNPVVRLAKDLLDEDPVHLVAVRHSPRDERALGSVVHDLLIHDVDIASQLMGPPSLVGINARCWPPSVAKAEIADCTLQFANGLGTLSASRMGQRKVRAISVMTSTMLVELDLLRADVAVYKNIRQEQPQEATTLTYRAETVVDIPFVRHDGEPLAQQLDYFVDLINGNHDRGTELESIRATHAVIGAIATAARDNTAEFAGREVL